MWNFYGTTYLVTSVVQFWRQESTVLNLCLDLTFTYFQNRSSQKPKSDFVCQFAMSKIIESFWLFFHVEKKIVSVGERCMLLTFFLSLQFLKWKSINVESKKNLLSDFWTKIYSQMTCPQNWGHELLFRVWTTAIWRVFPNSMIPKCKQRTS